MGIGTWPNGQTGLKRWLVEQGKLNIVDQHLTADQIISFRGAAAQT